VNPAVRKFRSPQAKKLALGLLPASLSGLLLAGCAGAPNMMAPQGPAAAAIANLGWLFFGLATLVALVVFGLFLYALFRRRGPDDEASPNRDRLLIIGGGVVIPAIILVVLFFFNLATMGVLAAPDVPEERVVEVVGRQWWWEVNYPASQVTTANEIHIPVGLPVQLKLTSADVIHSFWVPELHGKMDLIPNRTNTFWLQADQPGVYLGECAEFCGIQHAKMALVVVAVPPQQYAAWLEDQSQAAPQPDDPLLVEGQQIFLGSACVYCHTVKGTNATGKLGPDLTHLASRRTLAAGILENNRGNLAGWIINPQHIKPGNRMPPTNLSGPELQALLAYLESLE
jgi:cytochrome c oxidase subunit 2